MGIVFDGSTNPCFTRRQDMDGKTWLWGYATTGATAKYSYMMFVEEGYYRASLKADNTEEYLVGVPAKAVASATYGWFQIGGPVTDFVPTSLSVTALSVVNSAG